MTFRTTLITTLLLALLAVMLAACGGAATPAAPAEPAAPTATPDPLDGWVAFTAPDGSFSVRLPQAPETITQTVTTEAGDIAVAMYVTEDADGAMIVSHNGFPPAVVEVIASGDEATIQSILDGGRDGAVANVNGVLQDEKQITVSGLPGREFSFTIDASASPSGSAITGIARVILGPDRLYQMISLGTAEKMDLALVQAFFDSFQLAAGQ